MATKTTAEILEEVRKLTDEFLKAIIDRLPTPKTAEVYYLKVKSAQKNKTRYISQYLTEGVDNFLKLKLTGEKNGETIGFNNKGDAQKVCDFLQKICGDELNLVYGYNRVPANHTSEPIIKDTIFYYDTK